MAKANNQSTAIAVLSNQTLPDFSSLQAKLSPRAERILNEKKETIMKAEMAYSALEKQAATIKKRIEATPDWKRLKEIKDELNRLTKVIAKMRDSAVTTITDDLYDVPGETIIDKLDSVKGRN